MSLIPGKHTYTQTHTQGHTHRCRHHTSNPRRGIFKTSSLVTGILSMALVILGAAAGKPGTASHQGFSVSVPQTSEPYPSLPPVQGRVWRNSSGLYLPRCQEHHKVMKLNSNEGKVTAGESHCMALSLIPSFHRSAR